MISKKIVEASEVELNTNQMTASGVTKPYSSLLYSYVMWNTCGKRAGKVEIPREPNTYVR